MKSVLAICALLSAVSAVPLPLAGSNDLAVRVAAARESLQEAAANWQRDTGIVSDFLNQAASLSGEAFTAAAAKALAAEKNELTHKAVIDAVPALANTPSIRTANNVLATRGTFQAVVNALQDMVTRGSAVGVIDTNEIDANRCKNVLPSIDAYLKAAGTSLTAVRPTACDADSQTQRVTAGAGAAPDTAATGKGAGAAATEPGVGAGTAAGKAGKASTAGAAGTSTGSNAGAAGFAARPFRA